MKTEATIVRGPIVPSDLGGVIYEVTLPSGMIITNPVAFGLTEHLSVLPTVIVAKKGGKEGCRIKT